MSPTKRWHVAAVVMGALGFLAIVELLVVPQYAWDPTGTCSMAPSCFKRVYYETGPTLVRAVVSALVWGGLVYLVWALQAGIRLALKARGRRSHGR